MPDRPSLSFVEPMLLLSTNRLPEGSNWTYELKLDGYRALAIKTKSAVQLRSRNNKDFNSRYPTIVKALANLPDETIIDGEVVALDASGRPSFNALQNHGAEKPALFFYVFDVLMLGGRDVMAEPLTTRRALLDEHILPKLVEPVRLSPVLDASLDDLIHSVRAQGLEGLVAKRTDSRYEPGERSGAWRKMRLNRIQDFVVGGYTLLNAGNVDAVIFGYYEGDRLLCAGSTRNGLNPALRAQLLQRFQTLETRECPFANLPDARAGRWGHGLTAEKMPACHWLRPALVAEVEFLEWTPDGHLRHSRFVTLREGRNPRDVERSE
ncbi:MAG: non-homologous end-joining DNA ligase [Bryobacteraceae bacterium]